MRNLLHRIRRYIITIRVDVYPTHPEAAALMKVTHVWFKRDGKPEGQFLLLQNGRVNVGEVFARLPYIDQYTCHYPEDWFEQIAAYDERTAKARGARFV